MKRPNFNFPTETKGIFCFEHKKDNMVDITSKKCIHDNCMKQPTFNFPTETKAVFCSEHKKENMVDIKHKKCQYNNCMKRPNFNFPTEIKAVFCFEHKKDNMVNVKDKKCQHPKCKDLAIFGLLNKKVQYCFSHKKEDMINLVLENKCCILECENEYDNIIESNKYCNNHTPENYGIVVKKLCKYCDIKEESKFVCKDCKKIQNKKEWAIVRYLRKNIHTQFEYNSSKMLQGCSKKRPDIFFDSPHTHCVIVEIDENQHNSYQDSCECSRINEIVNGICGKSVIIIRYNPDVVKNNGKIVDISQTEKIDLLTKVIKEELLKTYETFVVKIIQLFYNDDYQKYKSVKEEIITDKVCI